VQNAKNGEPVQFEQRWQYDIHVLVKQEASDLAKAAINDPCTV